MGNINPPELKELYNRQLEKMIALNTGGELQYSNIRFSARVIDLSAFDLSPQKGERYKVLNYFVFFVSFVVVITPSNHPKTQLPCGNEELQWSRLPSWQS